MSTTKRSRAGRARNRGTAMLEAVVLIPLLLVLHISLLYMNRTYGSKLTTMRDARHDVWTRSLGSGGGGGADSSLSPAAPAMGVGRTLARGSSLTRPLGTGLTTSSASASARASGRDTGHGVLPTIDTQTTLTVIDDEKQSNISTTDIRMTIHSIYFTLL